MSIGTIAEFTPTDGLGWITLEDGQRIRFGATACGGKLPPVGARVRVLGTAPGFRGVLKATRVELLEAPPPAPPAPARRPRADLARLDALGPAFDDALRAVVRRADADDAFYDDLDAVGFQLAPMHAAELDCRDESFFVVAMDGGGNAFGRYRAPGAPGLPWVFWDHEVDTLGHVADDTATFFATLLGSYYARNASAAASRVRGALGAMGIALPAVAAGVAIEGKAAAWLQGPGNHPRG